jgi:hypothetical protein
LKYGNRDLSKSIFIKNRNEFGIVNDQGEDVILFDMENKNYHMPSYFSWGSMNSHFLATLFTKDNIVKSSSLFLFDTQGSKKEIVRGKNYESVAFPDWSYDDKYILYHKSPLMGRDIKLFYQNIDSSNNHLVDEGLITNATWFNHSYKILFKEADPFALSRSQRKLYVYDLDKDTINNIYDGKIYTTFPNTSPNDSLLAIDTDLGLTILNLEDGKISKTYDMVVDQISWSPNSKFIAFIQTEIDDITDRIKGKRLFILDINSSEIKNVTPPYSSSFDQYKWIDDFTIVY